jgi:hypothetical protein
MRLDGSSAMIQFIRVIGSFNYQQAVAIDEQAVHVVERQSQGLGYAYYSHRIELNALTRVDFIRESRGVRIRRGLMVFLAGIVLISLVELAFAAGWLIIPLTPTALAAFILAPLSVVLGWVSCFARRGMLVVFVADGRRYRRLFSAREWEERRTDIQQILDNAKVRCEHYG